MNQVKLLKLPNFETEYIKLGHGKKTLVFVPGLSRDFVIWIPTINELLGEYTIYAFVLPAYATNIPRGQKYLLFNLDQVVEDFLDHFELRRPVLLAHSLGSVACLQYAIKHPDNVDRLVLVSPPIHEGVPPVRHIYRFMALTFLHVRYADRILHYSVNQLKRAIDYLHDRFQTPISGRLNFLEHLLQKVPPRSLAKFYHDLFNADLSYLLADNEVPTLAIFGKRDRYLRSFAMAKTLQGKKNYQLKSLDAGHYIPRENPQELARVIEEYLKS